MTPAEARAILPACVTELTELQKQVVEMRYGADEHLCTFAEISAILHLPVERVEQIHRIALARMNDMLHGAALQAKP